MAFETLLAHRADVATPVEGADRFGQPTQLYHTVASDVPCRLTAASGREVVTLTSRGLVEITHIVYMHDLSVPINEGDRVTVRNGGGATLEDDLDIVLVKRISGRDGQQHHIECHCRKVKQ